MIQSNKKLMVTSIILGCIIILLVIFMILGLNLGFIKINSISSLIEEYRQVKISEKKLNSSNEKYNSTIEELKKSENEFNKQKNKYNSISDETVNVIKEATTEDMYNIEYMWIKLGNYAKRHNLELVITEPGGNTKKEDSKENKTNSSSVSNSNSNSDKSTSSNSSSKNVNNNSTVVNSSDNSTTGESNLTIQVTGSYMDTSDFIFEVENDASLRFKLDNISMDYVDGTTIKTKFIVKNISINK